MPRYVAFLRAVNVGRASAIKMDVLRLVFERLGFSNVSSFIASGNIVFEARAHDTHLLERRIEGGMMESLGRDLMPFVRSMPELQRLVAFDPFPDSILRAGDQLAVIFLSSQPGARAANILESSDSAADEFRVRGREVYWLRHRNAQGIAYSTAPLDKALTEPFTIRSISTLKKLASWAGGWR